MDARIYCDGASRSNPGHAAYGVYVSVAGRTVYGVGEYLGTPVSNNVAEYRAMVRGLGLALQLLGTDDVAHVNVYTDSNNVAEQLAGRFAVRAEHLVPLYDEARALLDAVPDGKSIRVEYVPRRVNALADALANAALDARGSVTSELVTKVS